MDYQPQEQPEPAPRDPLAVAIGNASLLGVGYLLSRRRGLAAATGVVTVLLLVLLATVARTVWFEAVVLVWWLGMTWHGWFLAGGRARWNLVRRQRSIALAVTIPVLIAVGLLRFDAAQIEKTVTTARAKGDCGQALSALDRVWVGHRVVDAPMTVRGETTAQACGRLREAYDHLTVGLSGDTVALTAGFADLSSVLAEYPGHEKMVDTVLDGFLGRLPAPDACRTAAVTDWLRQRPAGHNALDRAATAVPRVAPAALAGCGDALLAGQNWTDAQRRYQQLLDQYPGNELTGKAQDGVRRAGLALELADVTALLGGSAESAPQYCAAPGHYSAAAPYGKGVNHALVYGNTDYTSRLPADWKADGPGNAVLVLCTGDATYGTPTRTCGYNADDSTGGATDVTFHKIAIPVRAFELRTGNVVADTTVEIGGTSCPYFLSYTTFGDYDHGPGTDQYVDPSDDDIRAAFAPVIAR
ncbi:hypothetical protein [Amycolatopsis sp.]|uniref:hypothetical protein n=1 Tax=Amycolatopsis sp. TaxID=37632 RepID=UPI002CBA1478|nr:hypothetical protein [Amycolatopsis sp.]HVV12593.1 hypothetical protein [Amycolatopsis sp.]